MPVFQDAGHALHVSYLVHSMPARTVSPTAIVVDQLVKQNHVWDGLPAPQSSRVDFSGLSPLEVRAQCAHSNSGKGAGIKASDLDSFPLCTVHPGADGRLVQVCHENFDQGALFAKAVRRELEPVWAADTQRRILAMGLWPKALPLKNFSTGDDFERTLKNRT